MYAAAQTDEPSRSEAIRRLVKARAESLTVVRSNTQRVLWLFCHGVWLFGVVLLRRANELGTEAFPKQCIVTRAAFHR